MKDELSMYKTKLMQFDLNSNPPKGKFIMKPKKRLQFPSTKEEVQTQNQLNKNSHDKMKIKTKAENDNVKIIAQQSPLIHNKLSLPNSTSDKSSSQSNNGYVSIQPKTNNSISLKGPLKKFIKKQEPKKINEKVIIFKISLLHFIHFYK